MKYTLQGPWVMPGNPTTAPNWIEAINVLPTRFDGWQWLGNAKASNINALAAACLGAAICPILAGTNRIFAGTAAAIYELTIASPGTWTDRSRGGGYTSGTNRWCFCQFSTVTGTDVTIACNLADAMQKSTTAAFSDLATAPKAAIVVSASNALVAFNINDGTARPAGIKTSDTGDYTVWTSTAANEVFDTNILDTPGAITAAISFQDGIVFFKRTATYFMQYVGGDLIWDIRLLSPSIGCVSQDAVVDIGGELRWISDRGFTRFSGSVPQVYASEYWRYMQGYWFGFSSEPVWRLQFREEERQLWHWVKNSSNLQYCFVQNVDTGAWGRNSGQAGTTSEVIEAIFRISTAQKKADVVWSSTPLPGSTAIVINSSHAFVECADASAAPTAAGTLSSGYFGQSDSTVTVQRMIPIWDEAPDNTDTTNNKVTVTGQEVPYGGSISTQTSVIDSLNRFDMNVTGRYLTFLLTSKQDVAFRPSLYSIDLNYIPAGKD